MEYFGRICWTNILGPYRIFWNWSIHFNAAILNFSLSPWIGMFAGAGLSVLVAIIVGYPCFRLSSHFFALATIAFAEVLRMLALIGVD